MPSDDETVILGIKALFPAFGPIKISTFSTWLVAPLRRNHVPLQSPSDGSKLCRSISGTLGFIWSLEGGRLPSSIELRYSTG